MRVRWLQICHVIFSLPTLRRHHESLKPILIVMDFAVVEFVEDNSVDVVPSNWINDSKCYWPPFRALRLTAAVRKREEPLPSWLMHEVRVLNVYENYSTARSKLQRAEETSTLETDDENVAVVRQRRKKSFDDLDNQYEDVVVPKKKVQAKKIVKSSVALPVPPESLNNSTFVALTTHQDNAATSSSYSVHHSSVAVGSYNTTIVNNAPDSHLPSLTTTPSSSGPDGCQSPVMLNVPDSDKLSSAGGKTNKLSNYKTPSSGVRRSPRKLDFCHLPTTAVAEGHTMTSASSSLRRSPRKLANAHITTGTPADTVNKLILSKLTVIEQHQRHHAQMLQHIMNTFQSNGDDCIDLPDDIKIPLQSLNDLTKFEENLEDENTYRRMVQYFGSIGGKDVAETTRRILRSLLTNDVARRLNFAGRGSKTGIKNMKLLQLVTASVRRNKLIRRATRAEVEIVVKLWLRYAGDRSGGRQARERQSTGRVQIEPSDVDSE